MGRDDKITETLVGTLDAHAKALLAAVNPETGIPAYVKHLRRVGAILLQNTMKRSVLKDPYGSGAPLNAESLREEVDVALSGFQGRPNMVRRDSRLGSDRVHRGPERRTEAAEAATKMERRKEAIRWREWRNQLLSRIELLFEARYRHWGAEARDRVREKSTTAAGEKRRGPVGTMRWEDVKIEFLSDERVQIWIANRPETRNYAEMGFIDKRTGKPNQTWGILRYLAKAGGTVSDSARSGKNWSALEKHIQRIRKALTQIFELHDDPLPYLSGIGYRARFTSGVQLPSKPNCSHTLLVPD